LAKVKKRSTENQEAYQEYLQGRLQWKKRSLQGFAAAIKHFEKAIEFDPNFALAYAGLADIYVVYPYWHMESPSTAYPKARENAEKARTLDPTLAEPWASLAGLEAEEYNWNKAKELFDHSINLNKNYATAWQWRGNFYLRIGSHDLAVKNAKKAYELDPISPIISGALGRFKMYSNDPKTSILHFQKAYELSNKENLGFIAMTAKAYLRMNQADRGIEIINENFDDITNDTAALAYLAQCKARVGKKGEAYELLTTLLHKKIKQDRYINEQLIANIFAELGDKEKAFYWMNKAIENTSPNSYMFTREPAYDQWKNDPEYKKLLKMVRLDKQ
jgi:tetratricopeptide (TPR) repeat protein